MALPGVGRRRVRHRTQNQSTAILEGSKLLRAGQADVARIRARSRRRRLIRIIVGFCLADGYLWYRYITHNPIGLPHLSPSAAQWLPPVLLIVLLGLVILLPMLSSGRSPHVLIRPEHLESGLREVKGLDGQVDEVMHTLDVFLGYATFREQ